MSPQVPSTPCRSTRSYVRDRGGRVCNKAHSSPGQYDRADTATEAARRADDKEYQTARPAVASVRSVSLRPAVPLGPRRRLGRRRVRKRALRCRHRAGIAPPGRLGRLDGGVLGLRWRLGCGRLGLRGCVAVVASTEPVSGVLASGALASGCGSGVLAPECWLGALASGGWTRAPGSAPPMARTPLGRLTLGRLTLGRLTLARPAGAAPVLGLGGDRLGLSLGLQLGCLASDRSR